MSSAADPTAMWNGYAGRVWTSEQEVLDDLFRPFEERLASGVRPGTRVLDVGCGTGATSIAIAQRAGACTGVDVSEPMLALARERAAKIGSRAEFVLADAQTHAFEPASFDDVVSRFGVMFFADPARAFANLRRAAKGTLRVFVWRSPAENPFFTAPERAAAPLLPPTPPRAPDAPGMYSLADEGRIRHILEASGWSAIAIRPVDVPCTMPAESLTRFVARMGSVGRALESADDALRAKVVAAAREAVEPFVHGADVRFTSACWDVSASR